LPYRWTFAIVDTPVVNAGSLYDGGVTANRGLSRLIGANRGLWAAVLSHEVAHVARRHGIRQYLYHEYIQQQIRYWQMRSYYGDKSAGWTVLALRISGAIAEKKLSRDLEHDADAQGMLLMARAGYHPDYVFAMHHLLRINGGEQSKFGAFFSGHPRWETRDQRTEKAYSEALAEYNRLWPGNRVSFDLLATNLRDLLQLGKVHCSRHPARETDQEFSG
jgi:predicted Zn-dependent protease